MSLSDSAAQMERNSSVPARRRLPIGAEYVGGGRTHVRVWAPSAPRVEVVVAGKAETVLQREADGYCAGFVEASPGDWYEFRLDDPERLYPDPASRFQPEGPHGPSQVVDPGAFDWTDARWRGATLRGQVIYELHVGTFTHDGTFASAARELPSLARLGITMIEVMPVAEFEGRFGWGYDGVDLYAPAHIYGTPDDFRRFVNEAHHLGIAVILDVVYNHLGPSGNYLRAFSPDYFASKYDNEWGDALNFDGDRSASVREFFIENAGYWIDEFHLDGLRLDATQQIFDSSIEHVITALGRRAREAAGGRSIVIIAENEPQDPRLLKAIDDGGYGLDGVWNDDFHHSAMVALTGRAEAYYSDTTGAPQEFISAAKYGYLFQGQQYHWQRQPRGRPAWGIAASAYVAFLQNHDQVANSAKGLRGHQLTSPGRWRAMTALLLLGPWTPMLFQGQECSSSSPFLYFADFNDRDLADAVRKGRTEFLSQFPSLTDYLRHGHTDPPGDAATFERSKLAEGSRDIHGPAYALHRDLLRIRREDHAFSTSDAGLDGCVLGDRAFALRFFTEEHLNDRVLIVNLGGDLLRSSFAEPLLAPTEGADWTIRWSSEDPVYGGSGTPELWPDAWWRIPGESAHLLSPGSPRSRQLGPRRRTA
jgi:maltooligosyltrehalose trehalohydrolase